MATEGGTFVSVTGGTIETAMPGTFVSAAGGTFETVMPGTFHSATGGTFETVLGGTIKPLPSHTIQELTLILLSLCKTTHKFPHLQTI